MRARVAHRLALAVVAAAALSGCWPERMVRVVCPDAEPPVECYEWTPLAQPETLRHAMADALHGALLLSHCAEAVDDYRAAVAACREAGQ